MSSALKEPVQKRGRRIEIRTLELEEVCALRVRLNSSIRMETPEVANCKQLLRDLKKTRESETDISLFGLED